MTSFYGSVNGGQGGSGEGVDTSTLMQKNNPTFNGTITGPNARFTGTVQIPEPTEDNHAATKAYVDAALADVDLSEVTTRIDAIETAQDELAAQLDDKVGAENPTFTGTATLNGKNIATIDQIPDINDLPYLDENNPTYTGTLSGTDATFSGVVSVPAPTQDGQAVNKQYVDQAIAGIQTEVDLSEIQEDISELQTGKLDKANPAYTGNLTGENAAFSGTVTVATPTAEGEAANKGYVDSAKTELESDISTLQQTVNTINQQVTNITGGTEELPYLKNTGDSGTGVYDFTGATVNAADPVDNSNVATKHYVDQKVASAGGTGEVVSYTQGDGISISPENEISLSIDSAGANGLKVGTNGLGLDLATSTTPGAMAASDKTAIVSNTTEITNIKNGTTELPYLKETNPTYEGTLIGVDATFTGSVQISTPDQDNEAANKSYVDTALAAAKSYTDDAVSGIASDETIQQIQTDIENIEDGTTVLPYLKLSGGTITGPIKYGTNPQDTSDLANKAYVDAIHVQAVADAKNYTNSEITNIKNGTTELPYIKDNGDTVTGNYNLTGAAVTIATPAADNNPATKKYVDDAISAIDVSEQISPLTERVTAAEGEIDTLQTNVEAVETSVTNIINGTTELPYVKDSGDTVTGTYNFTGANVTIAEPTISNNPATKNYVDTKIASAGGSGEVVSYTQGNGINISPENVISVVVAADNANGLAIDTSGVKLNLATASSAGAMSSTDKTKLDATSTTEQMNQAISSAIDETLAEITEDPTKLPFVNINGDTMHGSLTTTELFTDFVTIRNAGTDGKTGFQNNSDTDHIRVYDKVADTLVPIEVGEPVNNQDASTKKYVDDKVTTETAARTEAIEDLNEAKVDKNNPTFTGTLSGANATLSGTLTGSTATFSGGVTVPLEPGAEGSAASKKYVDDSIAAIDVSAQIEPLTQKVTAAEAEIDTLQSDMTTAQSDIDAVEASVSNLTNGTTQLPYLPLAGGTVTGPVMYGTAPATNTELTNKAYVDAQTAQAKTYSDTNLEAAKDYTDTSLESVTERVAALETAQTEQDTEIAGLKDGTTELPYVTKEEVDINGTPQEVARAYRYTFNNEVDGAHKSSGFGFIDLTPAIVTEVDGATDFSPLYVGEPEKDTQAATKKYVDDSIADVSISDYTIVKQGAAEDGYFATYYLTKDNVQTGEKINIPKDYLVKEAELLEVTEADAPYTGAVIGDKYIDFTINTQAADEDERHIYLPVKDLVDVYTGGNGVNIDASNIVSVQIDAANANGLAVDNTGLKLNLATTSAAGAMSAADKTKLDTAVSKEQLTAIENEVDTLQTEVSNIKSGTADIGYLKAADPTYTGTLNGVNATFTGDVIVPTPDGDTEAANKSYVDSTVNAAKTELEGDINAIQQTVTTVQETVSGYDDDISAVQQTVTELGEDVSEVQQSVMQQTGTIDILSQTLSAITQGTMALPYVKKSGDTMSGELVVDDANGQAKISGGYVAVGDNNEYINILGSTSALEIKTDDNSYANVRLADPVEDDDAATKRYVDRTTVKSPAGLSTFTSYPIYTVRGEADYSESSMITTPVVDGPFHSLTLYGNTKVDNPENLLYGFEDGYYEAGGSKLEDTNGLSFSFNIIEGVTTYYISYSGTLKQDISSYSYAITEVMKNGSVFGIRGNSGAVPDTISVLNTGGQPSPTSKIIVSIYGTNFSTVQSTIGDAIAAGELQIGVDYMLSPDHPKEIKNIIGTDTEGVFYNNTNIFDFVLYGKNNITSETEEIDLIASVTKPFTLSNALDGFEGYMSKFYSGTEVPFRETFNDIDYFYNMEHEYYGISGLDNFVYTQYTSSCSDKYDYNTGKYIKNIGTFVVNGENAASVLSLGQVPTYDLGPDMNPILGAPRNVIKITVPNCVSGTLGGDYTAACEKTRASFASAKTGYGDEYQKILSSHFLPLNSAAFILLSSDSTSDTTFNNTIFYGYTLALTEDQREYYQNSLDGSICFISSSITTIEQATSYFSTHPLTIKYILNEPEEYDIPEKDMLFYKQMNKNVKTGDSIFIFTAPKNEEGNWDSSAFSGSRFPIPGEDNFIKPEDFGGLGANWRIKTYGAYDLYVKQGVEEVKKYSEEMAESAKEKIFSAPVTDGDITLNLSANCLYCIGQDLADDSPKEFTVANTINIEQLAPPKYTIYVHTYHFIFRSGATPTVLTLPETVIYPDGFEIEANRIYEINIMENLLSYQSWPVN